MNCEADKERTLVIVKPDGVQRGLAGEVISRFEKRGFKIVGLKMIRIDKELAEQHYGEHRGKDFFEPTVKFITSSPVVVLVVQGRNAVKLVRNMMGALKPEEAASGTIRGDFAVSKAYNVVHGSDSVENGKREINLYFQESELLDFPRDIDNWLRHDG